MFDGVTFCRCTPAAARLRNLYIYIFPIIVAGTPSDTRFEVVGKFFNVRNINHARVAERTTVVLLCGLYGGWPTNLAKITQRPGGKSTKRDKTKQ